MPKKRAVLQVTDDTGKVIDDMFIPEGASVLEYAQRLANHLIADKKSPALLKVQRIR